MELKNIDLKGEIFLTRDLNLVKLYFIENLEKMEFKNESYMLFIHAHALIAQKTR